MSGGLDSTLAARLVLNQGVEVVGLYLYSPFGCRSQVEKMARLLGMRLIVKDKGEAFIDLLKNPRFGYGKNLNPCVDCRIYMFQLADVIRQEEKADFIVTGEVVGQRPMSQTLHSIAMIDHHGPLKDLVLRPLSAKNLAPTLPEREGWVHRQALLGITGRSRKEQLRMAEEYGIDDFEDPGGGCLLTQPSFKGRLQDFLDHDAPSEGVQRLHKGELLKLGRHFRLSPKAKVVVGRNEIENDELSELWQKAGGEFYEPINFKGPAAVGLGNFDGTEKKTVGRILARYGKGEETVKEIRLRSFASDTTIVINQPILDTELEALRL